MHAKMNNSHGKTLQTCWLDPQKVSGVELVQDLSVEAARLNGQVIKLSLLIALDQNVLLDGLLADQAVDVDLTSLSNAMTPVLCLQSATTIHCSCRQWDLL